MLYTAVGAEANKNLIRGDLGDLTTIRFALPCQGISVGDWKRVRSKAITGDISEGRPVSWEDIIH